MNSHSICFTLRNVAVCGAVALLIPGCSKKADNHAELHKGNQHVLQRKSGVLMVGAGQISCAG